MDVKISDVLICSTALLELGSRPINNFTEDNEGARLCANMYGNIRDEQLRLHTWNFAKKRIKLSPDAEKPEFGFANQFTLPSDYIRCIEVNGHILANGVAWPVGYQIENGKVLADASLLNLRYVYRNGKAATWDAEFIRLMIAAMKKALAYPITRDAAVAARCDQEWALALKLAKTTNGIELPPQELPGQTFLQARY